MANNNFSTKLNPNDKLYTNVNQEYIYITKDKLKLALIESEKSLMDKKSWIAPFGIFVSTLIAILTADFKDLWFLSKDVWMAIFILICGVSCVLSIIKGIQAFSNRKDGNIDSIIQNIIREQNNKD